MPQLNLHQVIIALTEALDFVGIDELHHGKRVAIMAEAIARKLGWDEVERSLMLQAGMLHDCGVSQTREHKHLTDSLEWEGSVAHCERGASYLAHCPPLAHFSPLIRWHHTRWEHLPPELPENLRLQTNLIFLADRIDVLQAPFILGEAAAQGSILWEFPGIIERVHGLSGSLFAPALVEAFAEVAKTEAFWLAMDPRYFIEDLSQMAGSDTAVVDMPALLSIARLFSHVVDAKSAYTQDHSQRVACIARFLGARRGLNHDTLDMLEAAGLLHDLGKLRIPDEIIDKPGPLNQAERALITRHAYDSYRILNRVFAGTPIPYWAGSHHENLLGTGYPFHRQSGKLDLEARIIAVADIFQALSQTRPYRTRLPADEVLAHLHHLVAEQRIDGEVVELLAANLDTCYTLATA